MDDVGGMLGLLFVIGFIGIIIWSAGLSRKPFVTWATTAVSPTEALRIVVDHYTLSGWEVVTRTSDGATVRKTSKPSCLVAGLLLFLFLIPGILYLFFAGRTITAVIYAASREDQHTDVSIRGDVRAFGGLASATRALEALRPSGLSAVQIT